MWGVLRVDAGARVAHVHHHSLMIVVDFQHDSPALRGKVHCVFDQMRDGVFHLFVIGVDKRCGGVRVESKSQVFLPDGFLLAFCGVLCHLVQVAQFHHRAVERRYFLQVFKLLCQAGDLLRDLFQAAGDFLGFVPFQMPFDQVAVGFDDGK